MSINAIEVLEARMQHREWLNRQETQARVDRYLAIPEYPPPVDADGYEVTPASGVRLEH